MAMCCNRVVSFTNPNWIRCAISIEYAACYKGANTANVEGTVKVNIKVKVKYEDKVKLKASLTLSLTLSLSESLPLRTDPPPL